MIILRWVYIGWETTQVPKAPKALNQGGKSWIEADYGKPLTKDKKELGERWIIGEVPRDWFGKVDRWKDDSEFFGKRLGWIIDIVKLMFFLSWFQVIKRNTILAWTFFSWTNCMLVMSMWNLKQFVSFTYLYLQSPRISIPFTSEKM